jgi:hypothetical protein
LAFPNYDYPPTLVFEFSLHPGVARHVAFELGQPKFWSRLWRRGNAAATMSVPEAAVDENRSSVPGQHDIGATGQSLAMQPEAQAPPMKRLSNHHLRSSVLTSKALHERAGLFGIHTIAEPGSP